MESSEYFRNKKKTLNLKDQYTLQKWIVKIEEKKYKNNPSIERKKLLELAHKELKMYKRLLGVE